MNADVCDSGDAYVFWKPKHVSTASTWTGKCTKLGRSRMLQTKGTLPTITTPWPSCTTQMTGT